MLGIVIPTVIVGATLLFMMDRHGRFRGAPFGYPTVEFVAARTRVVLRPKNGRCPMCANCAELERKLTLIKSGSEPDDPETRQRFKALVADVERQLDVMRKSHPSTVH